VRRFLYGVPDADNLREGLDKIVAGVKAMLVVTWR
jgi:hypothetical protein